VDLSKEDFVGKGALEKASKEPRLFGYTTKSAKVNAGLSIFEDGQQVGHTRSSCWSPTLEMGIGYVVFDRPADAGQTWVGRHLTVRDVDGVDQPCEIVTLPFFDKEKRLPRGLPIID